MKLCWIISLMFDVMWRIENEIFRCLSARYENWSVQMNIQHKYDILIVYENYIIHACCPPTPFFTSKTDHFLNTIEHRVNFCLYNCGFGFHFRRMLSLFSASIVVVSRRHSQVLAESTDAHSRHASRWGGFEGGVGCFLRISCFC